MSAICHFLIFLLMMKTTSSSTYLISSSGSQLSIIEAGQPIGNFSSLVQFVQEFQIKDQDMKLQISGNLTLNETMIIYSNFFSLTADNASTSSFICSSYGQIQIISNISSNINFILENFKIIQSISDLLIFPLLLINNISFVQITVIFYKIDILMKYFK